MAGEVSRVGEKRDLTPMFCADGYHTGGRLSGVKISHLIAKYEAKRQNLTFQANDGSQLYSALSRIIISGFLFCGIRTGRLKGLRS